MTTLTVILLLFAAFGLVLLFKGLVIVGQSECMVIERLGSFSRVLDHGINLIVPFIDRPVAITRRRYVSEGDIRIPIVEHSTRIDLREMVLDFPGQPVVTRDNASVTIDGVLYYQIVDAKTAAYKVENLVQAIEVLAKTNLRSVLGTMDLDQAFESRDDINKRLQVEMDRAGDTWGVKVTRVEIQDITMPEEIKHAMHLQMAAERNRRAAVTEANGQKEAAILKAEGEKQSQILVAEGDRQATIARAEGEQKAISAVVEAVGGGDSAKAISYLMGVRYIEQLPDVAKEGDRVFLPIEVTSLMGAVGGLESLMKNLKTPVGQ